MEATARLRFRLWQQNGVTSTSGVARVKYTVILHRTEEGITVSVPGLPGCWSEGDTDAEAIENIQDAIQEYLKAFTMGGIVKDAGLSIEAFRAML